MMELGGDTMGVRGNYLLEKQDERSSSTNRDDVERRRAHNEFHNV